MPALEVVLLVVLLAERPGELAPARASGCAGSRSSSWACSSLAALWATALLIYDLITGAEVTKSPSELLAAGALVWLGNNLAFALLYWLIDSGGPIARAPGGRSRSTSRSRST